MFNTLQYIDGVGISRAHMLRPDIQTMVEIIEGDVATKQDLKELEYRLSLS